MQSIEKAPFDPGETESGGARASDELNCSEENDAVVDAEAAWVDFPSIDNPVNWLIDSYVDDEPVNAGGIETVGLDDNIALDGKVYPACT